MPLIQRLIFHFVLSNQMQAANCQRNSRSLPARSLPHSLTHPLAHQLARSLSNHSPLLPHQVIDDTTVIVAMLGDYKKK